MWAWTQEKQDEIDLILCKNAHVQQETLRNLLAPIPLSSEVQVGDALWEDSGVEAWMTSQMMTQGGAMFAHRMFRAPIANVETLRKRQQAILRVPHRVRNGFVDLQEYESDVLWALSLPKLDDLPQLQLLFPRVFWLRFINTLPWLIMLLHMYRGWVSPWMNLATPLTTIVGPWVYLRKHMKMKLPLPTYFHMLSLALKHAMKPSWNLKKDGSKYGSVGLYIVLFVVGTVQSFEVAKATRTLRAELLARTQRIRAFCDRAQHITAMVHPSVWEAYHLPSAPLEPVVIPKDLSGMYDLFRSTTLQSYIQQLQRRVYCLDMLSAWNLHIHRGYVTLPRYTLEPTKLWGMGHVALGTKQVRNPMDLNKSMVVTGPNAAGKTTYVKSLCANQLLAQTFGIVCARRGHICPVHALASFMRVGDELGSESLFQAEAKRCAELVSFARTISQRGAFGLFFLDEPLHSTPPVEGASACLATMEYLGNLPGIHVITTTHFASLMQLADLYPERYRNVCMEAMPQANGKFMFPYRIQKGFSTQCIALELLEDATLPKELVQRAIEWRNKICSTQVNDRG
jgi:hypothetical protein